MKAHNFELLLELMDRRLLRSWQKFQIFFSGFSLEVEKFQCFTAVRPILRRISATTSQHFCPYFRTDQFPLWGLII